MYLMQLIIINFELLWENCMCTSTITTSLLFICIENLNCMQFLQLGC